MIVSPTVSPTNTMFNKRPKVAWTEATPYLIYCAIAFAFGNLLFGM